MRVLCLRSLDLGALAAHFGSSLTVATFFQGLSVLFAALGSGPASFYTPTDTTESTTSNRTLNSGLHDAVPLFAAKDLWIFCNKPFSGDVDALLCTLGQTFSAHPFDHTSGHRAQ